MFRFDEKKKKKTTKIERICRLLKSTKKKSRRFRTSDITEFENSDAATEPPKTKEKVSKIKKTILIIFFIDLVIDLIVFFFRLNDLFHRNESDIRIRTIRHSSIEHRTERTSFVFESRKIEHTFNSLFQTVQTESLIILTSRIICVASRFKMNHVVRARLQIFESGLNEIRSLSKFHNFRLVSYVIANVCVLEHVICVVS